MTSRHPPKLDDAAENRHTVYSPDTVKSWDSWTAKARRELDAFLGGIDHGGKPIKQAVWNGRAHHEIITVAKRLGAELVTVGATGRTGIPYILLGSVTEHVLREASSDVLVAQAKSARFEFP